MKKNSYDKVRKLTIGKYISPYPVKVSDTMPEMSFVSSSKPIYIDKKKCYEEEVENRRL